MQLKLMKCNKSNDIIELRDQNSQIFKRKSNFGGILKKCILLIPKVYTYIFFY